MDINVLVEMERCGLSYEWASSEEIKTQCPFHPDHSPSCFINIEKRFFKCQTAGCETKGDFVTYLAGALKQARSVLLVELAKRYNFETVKLIDPGVIERYHQDIWTAEPLLKALYARGVTDALIRKYRLGLVEGRISIPIKNAAQFYVNIRKYLPGAPGKDKMRNLKGHGKNRLFPIEQMAYSHIAVCGGEMKAIVAAEQLNPHGIGAVCMTAGEGNWSVELLEEFRGKEAVYIIMDVDRAGRNAARQHCTAFSNVVSDVYDIVLPLDDKKYPKGDINDYVATEHGDIFELIKAAEQWMPSVIGAMPTEEAVDVELFRAANAAFAGRRINVNAVVAAMGTAPYVLPKDVRVVCDRSQKECAVCPIWASKSDLHTLAPESPALLEMVDAGKRSIRDALISGFGIPQSCRVVQFQSETYYNVEDVRIRPQLEITNRSADQIMQPAICLGEGLELNESYRLTGRMWPHPKTQQSTLLISKYEATQDALSSYECKNTHQLTMFRPRDWHEDALQEQLNFVYDDFEANVTRIFRRRDIHLMVDLAYHSPLFLNFDNKTVKGWLEVLIVGDSAQGKSEVACGSSGPGGLLAHYGLGEKVECKNASVAGLLGGLQQFGGRWFVTWGAIPTQDKRLVILEELKGASTEVIGKLTDMRSSGIAEIPKIERRRTHARTRLIAISNARGSVMSSYNFGIEAISELIGNPEDVRRFDAAMIAAASDIPAGSLNELLRSRPDVEHRFTSDICRSLVLWAWTRKPNEVVFEKSAQTLVLDAATQLSERFTDQVPLVDRGSGRYKVARLAAALAARTFSTDETMETLVVRDCHVRYITRWLDNLYSSPSFGYLDFTQATRVAIELIDPKAIRKQIEELPFPKDFVKQILHTSRIELQDVQDWCGWERQEAMILISFLVRKHAMVRDGRSYRKTPAFIELLKRLQLDGGLTDRPGFIPEF